MIKKLFLLAFLGLLVALTIPSSRSRIVDPVANSIRSKIAPRKVEALANQLEVRVNRGDGLPTESSFGSWIRRNTSVDEADPWGNPYFLERRRGAFVVGSMGADGQRGTPDDFTEQRRRGR